MDILMPKLDGYTACYEIKKDQLTRSIPVIMLTGIDYETSTNLSIWVLKLSSLANHIMAFSFHQKGLIIDPVSFRTKVNNSLPKDWVKSSTLVISFPKAHRFNG